jgi:tRNA (guanosine-2'-O-)-methyltransferase
VSLAKHSGAEQCLQELKARGFKICATDIHNASVSIYDMDWSGKCAIVLGNEDRGVSEDVRRMADVSFHIPMLGFAESLNLGVASAVITSFLAGAKQLEPNMPSNVQDRVRL